MRGYTYTFLWIDTEKRVKGSNSSHWFAWQDSCLARWRRKTYSEGKHKRRRSRCIHRQIRRIPLRRFSERKTPMWYASSIRVRGRWGKAETDKNNNPSPRSSTNDSALFPFDDILLFVPKQTAYKKKIYPHTSIASPMRNKSRIFTKKHLPWLRHATGFANGLVPTTRLPFVQAWPVITTTV